MRYYWYNIIYLYTYIYIYIRIYIYVYIIYNISSIIYNISCIYIYLLKSYWISPISLRNLACCSNHTEPLLLRGAQCWPVAWSQPYPPVSNMAKLEDPQTRSWENHRTKFPPRRFRHPPSSNIFRARWLWAQMCATRWQASVSQL